MGNVFLRIDFLWILGHFVGGGFCGPAEAGPSPSLLSAAVVVMAVFGYTLMKELLHNFLRRPARGPGFGDFGRADASLPVQ